MSCGNHQDASTSSGVCCSTVLKHPALNKGTAFGPSERQSLRLRGLLPPRVESLEEQVRRAYAQLSSLHSPIEKYSFLQAICDRNVTLFYKLMLEHMTEILPLVYTPTVGEACVKFSHIWRGFTQSLFISLEDRGRISEVLANWPEPEVDIIVVSDGSRILGLGDLGANGAGIPIGKLQLYVAGAGLHPSRTLPVLLDTGTNNQTLLDDPMYLGLRQKKATGREYYDFVEEFMTAAVARWPHVLIQFEDFSNDHAFELLDRYRHRMLTFNDDIQGTGAVILAGFITAARRIAHEVSLKEHRLVFLGAGSAGIGVADSIVQYLVEETGMSPHEARNRFYMVDSKGLVCKARRDFAELAAFKLPYARDDVAPEDANGKLKNLLDVVRYAKPTALIGLAAVGRVFTEEIIREMCKHTKTPLIFALSNPTDKSECTAEEAIRYSDGRAIFACGSPFDPVDFNGKRYYPGQGNNMYIFPGLGLGVLVARATKVTDGMVAAAARALADSLIEKEAAEGKIYPDLPRIREISAIVATAVVLRAQKEGVARLTAPSDYDGVIAVVKKAMYWPTYDTASVPPTSAL